MFIRSLTLLPTVISFFWLLAVCVGFAWMLIVAGRSGVQPEVPSVWPAASAISPPNGTPVLVCILHPNCPCSLATVDGLASLIGQGDPPVRIVAVLARSAEIPDANAVRSAARAVRALPGVMVVEDSHGDEARCFAAATSGDCRLFSCRGELLYRGGLTDARGHGGRSRGLDAVAAHLAGRSAEAMLPVYGCAILDQKVTP